eukprot:2818870-Pleurochrysis_carterae.AAC.2
MPVMKSAANSDQYVGCQPLSSSVCANCSKATAVRGAALASCAAVRRLAPSCAPRQLQEHPARPIFSICLYAARLACAACKHRSTTLMIMKLLILYNFQGSM